MARPDDAPLAYAEAPRVAGVRSRFVDGVNGLSMHVLESGDAEQPAVLLLHGFPELAYSWRHQMPALAAAGFHVLAPDQRGYGPTTGHDTRPEADLAPYRLINLARDALALLHALRIRHVAAVVGHDFGSFVAAICALLRPDVFRAVALMSAPFGGPPKIGRAAQGPSTLPSELAALRPPRQHYQWYFSSARADDDLHHPPQGLHDFLRAYLHVKSADWNGNLPFVLPSSAASEYAKLPHYYVMPLGATMPQAVAPFMPSRREIDACAWMPDEELRLYTSEFARTGFQGGLNWYRCITDPAQMAELELFSGRTIDVPSCYIAGAADWGIHQAPGVFERMQREACTKMLGVHLVADAGHWVQQEQPAATTTHLLDFLTLAAEDFEETHR